MPQMLPSCTDKTKLLHFSLIINFRILNGPVERYIFATCCTGRIACIFWGMCPADLIRKADITAKIVHPIFLLRKEFSLSNSGQLEMLSALPR